MTNYDGVLSRILGLEVCHCEMQTPVLDTKPPPLAVYLRSVGAVQHTASNVDYLVCKYCTYAYLLPCFKSLAHRVLAISSPRPFRTGFLCYSLLAELFGKPLVFLFRLLASGMKPIEIMESNVIHLTT